MDEQKYQFEAVLQLRMSWRDPRARAEILRRTAETFGAGKPQDCERPCGDPRNLVQCCDTMFLPGVHAGNVVGIPSDWSSAEVISVREDADGSDLILWMRRIHSSFHSPLFFQRFPFDRYPRAFLFTAPSSSL